MNFFSKNQKRRRRKLLLSDRVFHAFPSHSERGLSVTMAKCNIKCEKYEIFVFIWMKDFYYDVLYNSFFAGVVYKLSHGSGDFGKFPKKFGKVSGSFRENKVLFRVCRKFDSGRHLWMTPGWCSKICKANWMHSQLSFVSQPGKHDCNNLQEHYSPFGNDVTHTTPTYSCNTKYVLRTPRNWHEKIDIE